MNAYWLGISFMWNALHPIVLPAILITLVPDSKKNTYLGLLTFAGLVTAMIIQPLSGAISDRWQSRYGRRRPLMVAATILECVFLLDTWFERGPVVVVHRLHRPTGLFQYRAGTPAGLAA